MSRFRVSVDIGGTFTDFVVHDQEAGHAFTGKVLSTPHNPAEGVIAGLTALDRRPAPDRVHRPRHDRRPERLPRAAGRPRPPRHDRGLQGCLRDRPRRPEEALRSPLRASQTRSSRPSDVHTVRERVRWDGVQVRDAARSRRGSSSRCVEQVEAEGIDAVAVCFLHANVNPVHELEARRIIAGAAAGRLGLPLARGRAGVARVRAHLDVVLNAYIAPVIAGLPGESGGADCRAAASRSRLHVMQSNGGAMTATAARRLPDPDAPLRAGRRHHRRPGVERGPRPAEPASASTWAAPPSTSA